MAGKTSGGLKLGGSTPIAQKVAQSKGVTTEKATGTGNAIDVMQRMQESNKTSKTNPIITAMGKALGEQLGTLPQSEKQKTKQLVSTDTGQSKNTGLQLGQWGANQSAPLANRTLTGNNSGKKQSSIPNIRALGAGDSIRGSSSQEDAIQKVINLFTKPQQQINDWEGRDALVKELQAIDENSGWITDEWAANETAQRRAAIIQALEEGDELHGNGLQSYSDVDRARQVFSGATKDYASGITNKLGNELAMGYEGIDTNPYAGWATDELSRTAIPFEHEEDQLTDYAFIKKGSEKLEDVADKLGEGAAKDLASAKVGLSKLGQAGVDIATNVIQMGFDAALGGVIGSGLVPMYLRSAGSAARQARLEGADVMEQYRYGVASGAIEAGTEMLGNGVSSVLSKVYGKGLVDDATEEIIRRVAKSDFGRSFLRFIGSGAGEGTEEVVADLLSPLAQALYKQDSIGDLYRALDPREIAYDYIIGAAIGLMGGGIGVATGLNQAQNELLRAEDRIREKMKTGLSRDQATSEVILEDMTEAEEQEENNEQTNEEESTSVDTDPEDHTPEEQAVIDEYQAAVDEKVKEGIEKARSLKDLDYRNKFQIVLSDTVGDRVVSMVKNLTGIDVSGFRNIIKGNAVQHIDKRHGANGKQDNTMADINDFARINYVVENADDASLLKKEDVDEDTWKLSKEYRNADNTRAPLIRFEKKVNGTYYVVEAVPDSKANRIAVVSAYMKNKTAEEQEPHAGSTPTVGTTSETNPATTAASTTVPQETENGNTELTGLQLGAQQEGANNETVEQESAQTQQGLSGPQENRSSQGEESLRLGAADSNRASADTRAAAAGETATGTDLSDRSGRRDIGGRTGGQAGSVVSNAGTRGRVTADGERRSAAGKSIGYALRQRGEEALTSNQWGITKGTDRQTFYAVPEDLMESGWRDLKYQIETATGYEVNFIVGPMEVTGTDGKTYLINGCCDHNTERITIRVDSKLYSPEQIGRHEEFHARAKQDPGLVNAVRNKIAKQYSEEEMARIIRSYIEHRRGINNIESGNMDVFAEEYTELCEEIFADAYGQMNAFEAGANRFWYTTANVASDRYNSRAANGERITRGPPSTEELDRVAAERAELYDLMGRLYQQDGVYSDRRGNTYTEKQVEEFVRRYNELDEQYERMVDQTPMPENNQRYTYGGESAWDVDFAALDVAEKMEQEGQDADTIRKDTGWFRGMDGRWRFEIDDSAMELRDDYEDHLDDQYTERGLRLKSLIQHETLFDQYPHLADVDVAFDIPAGSNTQGMWQGWNGGAGHISINQQLLEAGMEDDLLDTLVHEIQHAVQDVEGFTRGSNPRYWERQIANGFDSRTREDKDIEQKARESIERFRTKDPEFYEEMTALMQSVPTVPRGKIDWDTLEQVEEDPQEWKAFDAERDRLEEKYGWEKVEAFMDDNYDIKNAMAKRRSPEELYYNTAGEIEARDAASRRKFGREERIARQPKLGNGDTVFAEKTGASYDIKHPTYTEEDIKNNSLKLQNMDIVKELTGNEFAVNGKTLYENVLDYFNSLGNKVESEEFGDVDLPPSSVRSDIRHGNTRNKIIAYAAIPEVIQNGTVIYTIDKGRGLERIVTAAPIRIGEQKYYMAVMLQRNPKSQRLYAHDVVIAEEPTSSAGEHLSTNRVGRNGDKLFITDILQKALAVKSEEDGALHLGATEDGKQKYSADEDETEYTGDRDPEQDARTALEYFGKTYNMNEAGYIMRDGSMLDFSGRRDGARGGRRTVDHRDILDAFDDSFGGGDGNGAMIEFMRQGNIRILPENGGINLQAKPTPQQRSRLEQFIQRHRGEVYIDFDDKNGNTIVAAGYDPGTRSSRILNEIDAYYDYGEKPEEREDVYYSVSEEEDEEYMDAVESGNTIKAQEMVEQAANAAMPDSKLRTEDGKLRKVYHGTNSDAFTVFDENLIGAASGDEGFFGRGFYFAYTRGEARAYGRNVMEAYLNLTRPYNYQDELCTIDGERTWDYNGGRAIFIVNFAKKFPELAKEKTVGVFDMDNNRIELSFKDFAKEYMNAVKNTKFDIQEMDSRDYGTEWLVTADPYEESYTDPDGVKHTWREYRYQQRFIDERAAQDRYANALAYLQATKYPYIDLPSSTVVILESDFTNALKKRGFDGVIQSTEGDEAVAFYPEQIKSADPVTRDDEGNVIHLSERFNPKEQDIRYSMDEDQMTMDDLTGGDYSLSATEGPNHEWELARVLTAHVKDLLTGYQAEGRYEPITEEDIDDWMEPNIYHTRMESLFEDGDQVLDELYELSQDEPEDRDEIFELMERIVQTMDPGSARKYTEEDIRRAWRPEERYEANLAGLTLGVSDLSGEYGSDYPDFAAWYSERNPSLYYPGYQPGDLTFRRVGKVKSYRPDRYGALQVEREGREELYEDQLASVQNERKERNYLYELLDNPNVSDATKEEARAFLDRLENERPGETFYSAAEEEDKGELSDARLTKAERTIQELKKDNEQLKEYAEYWKKQGRITGRGENRARRSDVQRFAKELIEHSDYQGDKAELRKMLQDLANMIVSDDNGTGLSWKSVHDAAEEIAEMLVDNSYQMVDPEKDLRESLKASLKELKIRPDEMWTHDFGDWTDFRRKQFGKLIFSREGESIDEVYKTLRSRFGDGMFPEDVMTGSDQVNQILAKLDELQPERAYNFANDEEANMAEAYYTNRITDELLFGNIREELSQADKNYQKVKERMQKAEQKVKQLREEKNELQKMQRFEMQDALRKQRENLHRREETQKVRKRIDKTGKRLLKYLTENTGKNPIPEPMKEAVGKLLLDLDLSGGMEKHQKEKYLDNMREVAKIVTRQFDYMNGQDDAWSGIYLDLPPSIKQELDEHLENIQKAIRGEEDRGRAWNPNMMNLEELTRLDEILTAVSSAIQSANDILSDERGKKISEMAEPTIQYINKLGKDKDRSEQGEKLNNFLRLSNTTPFYFFKKMGPVGTEMFERLQEGWDKFAFNARKIIDFANKTYTAKEVKEIQQKTETFQLRKRGDMTEGFDKPETVSMTHAQIMSLYCLWKREQARNHIAGAGIRIADFKNEKGKKVKQAENYLIDLDDIAKMVATLTPREREIADELQKYMNSVGSDWGNEVSLKRFGIRSFTEDNYFPIETDDRTRPVRSPERDSTDLYRLLNMGFTKATKRNASNALVVNNIFDVFSNHMADMAKYNGLGLPMLDILKWFSFSKLGEQDENGQYGYESIQKSVDRAFGRGARNYFTTFIKDLNGVQEAGRGEGPWNAFLSNYKVAAVGANLRVALLQPTSYLRAGAVLDGKYLAKGLTMDNKKGREEALKYSGTAAWKDLGFYDTNINAGLREIIKHDDGLKEKVQDAAMKGAEMGDKITWGALWNACKAEQEDKGLKGEELIDATAKRFREVVYRTQVMDSTMTRSHLMRQRGGIESMVTAFMSEPTVAYNMMLDAYGEYEADRRKGLSRRKAWENSGKYIAKTGVAYLTTATLAAFVESLMDAARDDDEYATFLERFLEKFPENWLEDVMLHNKLPVIKDFASMLKGQSTSRMDTEWMANVIKAGQIWWETLALQMGWLKEPTKITYNGNMTMWGKIYNTLRAVSQLTGLPFGNAVRDAVAIYNSTIGEMPDAKKIQTYDPGEAKKIQYAVQDGYLTEEEAIDWLLHYELADNMDEAKQQVYVWAHPEKYERMLSAMNAGDREEFDAAMQELKDLHFKPSNIEAAISKEIHERYVGRDGEEPIDRETAKQMLMDYGGMIERKAEEQIQKWTSEIETGVAFNEISEAYVAGDITRDQAVEMLMDYGGYAKEKAEAQVQKWSSEIETGIRYSDLRDAFFYDEVTREEAIDMYMKYGGKSLEDAEDAVNKIAFEKLTGHERERIELETMYMNGEYSRDQMKDLMVEYGYSKDEESAENSLIRWDFIGTDYEELDAVTTWQAKRYYELIEDAEIDKKTYLQFAEEAEQLKADYDENGKAIAYSKMNKVFALIDSLDLTDEQKTALAEAGWDSNNDGYSAKNIEKYAPWEGGSPKSTSKKKSGGGRRGGGGGRRSSGPAGGLILGEAVDTGHRGIFDQILVGWKRKKYTRAMILAMVRAGTLTQEEADEILATPQDEEEIEEGLTLGAAEE